MKEKLLNTKELAEYLGIAVSTLLQYRADGVGPEYIKLGHLVRYRIPDVEAWLESKKS
ncbi:MAG: helix-turn-helix domain-containing protein [Bacteroidales bacterium]|nr:helix-turn-helix domain-containing protein [Bacteroidales bacterium]